MPGQTLGHCPHPCPGHRSPDYGQVFPVFMRRRQVTHGSRDQPVTVPAYQLEQRAGQAKTT
ncbi:hypothetical protein E2C01_102566 [Portunus trituberculatus]|uniref:Uncharacterized protein n=1 Tax=Portunus trituberculatus TaxID=210409 RepID=A0A5B7KCY6_PORTR|nr:hypothetical protein [Portunus trituberculatus]